MPQVNEEELRLDAMDTPARPRKAKGFLHFAAQRTDLLPVLLVLTVMMVALWLMGMPFLQALTISTAVKISMVLLAARRPPCASEG